MSEASSSFGNKIKYKVVLLGDQSVGKSCIIEKYINDKFDDNSSPTVGIDFLVKSINYKNRAYRLQLWDTAGQERFRSLIPTYLKDSNCAVIVYDVTNKASFMNAEKWLEMYKEYKSSKHPAILVANKIDLHHRIVSRSEGEAQAKLLKTEYMQVSAKTGKNLEKLFQHAIDLIGSKAAIQVEEILEEPGVSTFGINQNKPQNNGNTGSQSNMPSNLNSIPQPVLLDVTPQQKKKRCCENSG